MEVHFDFLYSECRTQEDKNRFLRSMLSLLDDPQEIAEVRRRFYTLSWGFAVSECKEKLLRKMVEIIKKMLRGL